MSDFNTKLAAARTRLIIDKPFLGALVLRLPLVEADASWCRTTATDARSLYFNPDYIAALSLSQVQFVIAHEALHCGLSHFARREHRDCRRWDVACDYAVNQLLVDDDLVKPPGTLFDETYDGMTAEEIYPCIDSESAEEPMDQHLYDGAQNDASDRAGRTEHAPHPESEPHGGAGKPPPLTERERDQMDTQWQQRLAGAAQLATQAGKLSGNVSRMLDRLLRPSVPWRALLARHMCSTARTDYDLRRPSQRREGDAIFPSLHARQIDVVIALDTSGSIKQDELDTFLGEITAIKGAVNARVTLLSCDSSIDDEAPWIFEAWEALRLPQRMKGGGATDFTPVFDWVASNPICPDLLIYFTDARGRFPEQQPAVATLWLVKGSAPVPWGQRIQLN